MIRNKNSRYGKSSVFCFCVAIICCLCYCKPVIKSFKVSSHDTTQVRRIALEDTMKVNWEVKGKPTLLIHEFELPDSGGKITEMRLVVEKGGKEVNRIIQVERLPGNSSTSITLNTQLRGDTLVAEDEKNKDVWGDRFEIFSVSNASKRNLTVTHANRNAMLDASGSPSTAFEGTPIEGTWKFASLLTKEEKADHTLLPERLQINAIITYKRR